MNRIFIPSRRNFIKSGAVVLAGGGVLNSVFPLHSLNAQLYSSQSRDLINHSLDVARSNKAEYADVRLTHTFVRQYPHPKQVLDTESITVGIRCLVNGYWGFASGPIWTKGELGRLATEAAAQAKVNSLGKERECKLADTPVVPNGSWTMPIETDPFTIHPTQVYDLIVGLSEYAKRRPYGTGVSLQPIFQKQNKIFGSTDGTYYSQTTYNSAATGGVVFQDSRRNRSARSFRGLSPAGIGFEILDEKDLREQVDILLEEIRQDMLLPVIPIDVGRYSTMFSANVVSDMLNSTIGFATEMDRVHGYEANAGGTSYINDPEVMLDRFVVGNPLLTVTANRSMPKGAATVKWDDEGVTPTEFTLVREGVVADLQTSRESAEWLRNRYSELGREVISHGCASASGGIDAPLVRCANIVMKSEESNITQESLREGLEDGIEVSGAIVRMDFQQLNGWLNASQCYQVKNGKRNARIVGAGSLFRAPELWKSLVQIGGESTREVFGQIARKGQPAQVAINSVAAVPIVCENVPAVDVMRKA